MAEFTENYGLEKPAQNEFYNVDVQNQNMDKIDQAIAEAGNNPQLEIDVAEIKDKIGSTADTGGSSTSGSVFAKLNYLISQVKANYITNIYSWCSSLVSKMGNTNDTGGTATAGSVNAKLNDVIKKNGKIADSNGEFLTAISTLESMMINEISRSNFQANPPSLLKVDNTSIYYVDSITNKVIKLDKTTLAKTGETVSQLGRAYSIEIDATHVYYYDYELRKVIKFLKSNLSKVAETPDTYIVMSSGLFVDDTSVYLYEYTQKKVIKINKSTLVKTGESEVITAETSISPYGMQLEGNNIYLSVGKTTGGYYFTFKFDKSTLSKITEASKNMGSFYVDDYIYSRISGSGTSIIKVDKTTLETVSQFVLAGASLSGIVGDGDYLYVNNTATKQVLRINKDTMTLSAMTESTGGNGDLFVDEGILYKADVTDKVIVKYDKTSTRTKYQITGYIKE